MKIVKVDFLDIIDSLVSFYNSLEQYPDKHLVEISRYFRVVLEDKII